MTDRTVRNAIMALLASSALASPAFAQADPNGAAAAAAVNNPAITPPKGSSDTPPRPAVQVAQDGNQPDQTEIIVTAQKREENLQNVPISVQAIGTRRLDQLNISNFEEYTKQLPSVSFQTSQPGSTVVYMRGVATGGDGNHSGSLPSVGSYLDEQPITTIGGTLDVHIYDIARIESLAGPQGTLYGASSEAGTIRIITNKPELGVTSGRVDGEINTVDHGGMGGKLEGVVNLPVTNNIAFRGVAFYQKDAGYIDNVFGERTYASPRGGIHFDNSAFTKKNFNTSDTYGGRAALKIDLSDNWTATPSIMHQNLKSNGVFFMDQGQGDLKTVRFMPEVNRDKFTQAALTVEGKIANFDVTYAGAYMDRPTYSTSDYTDYTDAYDAYYIAYGYQGILDYQHYVDNAGNEISPRQHITARNHFRKLSQELRIASPSHNPFRVLAGAFYQRQTNDIFQNYLVDNLADSLSVPGHSGTIWLTKQKRADKDYALFGEATWDITPQVTVTAGGRLFRYDNSLFGFAGFGPDNPGGFSLGYNRCLTVNGIELRNDPNSPFATGSLPGTPCSNVANVVGGKYVPRRSKGSGFTHRLNAQWKPTDKIMVYATWSRGFRPGGINRQPTAPPYSPDYLTNYEIGWKTTFGRIRWNGAIYHQIWKGFQFSFLGENSLTVIQNGRDAKINGIESDINYVAGGLTFNVAAAYTDAKTSGNICNISYDTASGCDSTFPKPNKPGEFITDFIVTPSGHRLPVTPRFKMSATARYAWNAGSGKMHVQAGVSHQSSASADIRLGTEFLGRIKSSTLVDLFAGYDWGRYTIEAFGTNIFDQRNELSRFVVCSICTQVKIVPGRPRTLGIRLGAKF